jgi:hypothetical protein
MVVLRKVEPALRIESTLKLKLLSDPTDKEHLMYVLFSVFAPDIFRCVDNTDLGRIDD